MKENVERPEPADRHHPPAARAIEEREDGGLRARRAGDQHRVAYDARVEQRYPLAREAILAGASPQLRNAATVGRQPAAADPLLLLLRHGDALQQARAGHRLPGDRRRQPHPRHPGRQRALHRHPSFRHVRRAGRARGDGPRRPAPNGDRAIPFADFHRLPGDTPHIDTNLRAGRDHHRGRSAAPKASPSTTPI